MPVVYDKKDESYLVVTMENGQKGYLKVNNLVIDGDKIISFELKEDTPIVSNMNL